MFTIAPIAIDAIVQEFDPILTPVGLTGWHDVWYDAVGSPGTTPLQFEMGAVPTNELLEAWDTHIDTRIVPFNILQPLLDHKGDFPPMMDSDDREGVTGRDLSNQLARIDITHPQVRRMHEVCIGCGSGGFPPGGGSGSGAGIAGAIQNWPLTEDSMISIGQGYRGRAIADYVCGEHRALDLNHVGGDTHGVTEILSVAAGTVTFTGRDQWNGPNVIVTHPIPPLPSQNTFTSRYVHLAQILVAEGDNIFAGHQIGTMGSEGLGNALHLHFQLRRGPTCAESDTIDPCEVLPVPANGVTPDGCYRDPIVTNPDADVKTTICTTVEREIALYGADPYFDDDYGNHIRKSTLAAAIAYGESRWNTNSQNCIPDVWYGGTYLSHVGLYQTQNPQQIDNDILAGIVRAESVITNDFGPPDGHCTEVLRGVRVAQDYKIAGPSIMSFLRQSSLVSYLTPWHVYTIDPDDPHGGANSYLNHLALSACPPDTWVLP